MKTATLLEILYEINDGDYVYDGKRHIITTIITMKSMDKKDDDYDAAAADDEDVYQDADNENVYQMEDIY